MTNVDGFRVGDTVEVSGLAGMYTIIELWGAREVTVQPAIENDVVPLTCDTADLTRVDEWSEPQQFPTLKVDRELRAAYVVLREKRVGKAVRTIEVTPTVLVDVDIWGDAIGIEILDWKDPE